MYDESPLLTLYGLVFIDAKEADALGILMTCPIRRWVWLRLFRDWIALVVVPNRLAIFHRESPLRTEYVSGLFPEALADGEILAMLFA